jgi:Rrf2 family protein
MKLITKETDYAIRAIMNLARGNSEFASSRDISEQEEIPLHFLRRILQVLIKKRLVESKEGIAGGVRLRSKPQDIHLTDLIKIFQGDIQLAECMFRSKICSSRKTCVLRKRICKIEDMVTREFEDITIADLLNDLGVER